MANPSIKTQDSFDLDDEFRQMCLRYAEFLAEEGTRARPFKDPSLPFFTGLSPDKKVQAIEKMRYALEVFEETRAEGFRLKDSPKLIWRSLRKLGWTPPSDIFDKMGDDDVIAIYDVEHTHVFQNLCFFDWISFSLEELYSTPFYRYARREVWAAEAAYKLAVETVSGEHPVTYVPDIKEHYVEEVGTEELLKFYLRYKCISPIRSGGKIVGSLVVAAFRKWDGIPCAGPLV